MSKLFPASVVGSLPRPLHVRKMMEKAHLSEGEKREMDEAVRGAIAMQ